MRRPRETRNCIRNAGGTVCTEKGCTQKAVREPVAAAGALGCFRRSNVMRSCSNYRLSNSHALIAECVFYFWLLRYCDGRAGEQVPITVLASNNDAIAAADCCCCRSYAKCIGMFAFEGHTNTHPNRQTPAAPNREDDHRRFGMTALTVAFDSFEFAKFGAGLDGATHRSPTEGHLDTMTLSTHAHKHT